MRGALFTRRRCLAAAACFAAFTGSCTLRADCFATRVSASVDDAKVYGSNMEIAASDALVGYTGYYSCDFLARFTDVTVPQGARVDSAFMVMRASSSQSGTVCSGTIYAEDTAAAESFSSYADYAARFAGDSVVGWEDIPALVAGDWLRSPDIAVVIGEIIGRQDWAEGNALAVFLRDNNSSSGAVRRFSQFDANGAYACSLLVYYTSSAPPAERKVWLRRRGVVQ